ncbi:MAG TPA: ARMT1-like domain-containing protein [Phycisphaerae bacterium]|nr:ARMT1-like domain-containing protein [Phycisphaerae bacterium]HOJ75182.1 ARMT1-like domain-containing protein [Phycisphaerae bacterium]HOQ85940.1 ARMT1-like domain-containing protein [Phycisphaerae bacterium]HPP27741.1 ARMT1-like domain-containing protein [Phycisphaerae bacterium]HPZ98850.1 ARMT1-like domain-containing protein [Phycisphaerae bacterium]
MPVLCQLVDPDQYCVSEWNVGEDPWDRHYWIDLFERFPGWIEPMLRDDPQQADSDFDVRWPAFLRDYHADLDRIRRQTEAGSPLRTIDLTRFRNRWLAAYGWPDPYRQIKARENAIAADLYPRVVERIDAIAPDRRWERLIRGIFAGNMFDLGSPKTVEMYERGEIDFETVLERVPPRPWFIDQADALIERLGPPARYRQALIFADNAGSDIVLGVIPVAREMARAGMRVVIAANDGPALNDITIAELGPLLKTLAGRDAVLAEFLRADRIAAVGSGGDTPLIDLGHVSEACNAEAARSDLVVLEGMGRGVESNWDRQFKCDVWRVAMLKDESVIRHHKARLFDAVCRFDPA